MRQTTPIYRLVDHNCYVTCLFSLVCIVLDLSPTLGGDSHLIWFDLGLEGLQIQCIIDTLN